MKKKLMIAILLLSSMMLFASPRFGYAVSGRGETFSSDFGGVGFALVAEPFDYGICTLEAGTTIGNDSEYGFGFDELHLSLATPVFYVLSPFDLLFTNKMIWAPRLSVMTGWNHDFDFRLGASFSPFHFEDPNFRFDFLAPYFLTTEKFDSWGWGIDVLKVSFVF